MEQWLKQDLSVLLWSRKTLGDGIPKQPKRHTLMPPVPAIVWKVTFRRSLITKLSAPNASSAASWQKFALPALPGYSYTKKVQSGKALFQICRMFSLVFVPCCLVPKHLLYWNLLRPHPCVNLHDVRNDCICYYSIHVQNATWWSC